MSPFVIEHARYDRVMMPFEAALQEAAQLHEGVRVLDVGCGAGTTTLAAAEVTRVALGIDLEPSAIVRARERAAEQRSPAEFVHGDAASRSFRMRFDVILSRFGMHVFEAPVSAFAHLRTVLDEGRVVFTCWRPAVHNEWITLPARALRAAGLEVPLATLPFTLADPGVLRTTLRDSGFREVDLDVVEAPLWIGADVDDALTFFFATHGKKLVGTPLEGAVRERLRTALAGHRTDGGVRLQGSAWIVRAR